MTLEEAATGRTQGPTETRTQGAPTVSPMRDLARVVHLMDYQIQVDKARIAEAKKQAIERGLEADEEPRKRRQAPARFASTASYRSSRRRMEPYRHARVLLEETTLPVEEIASITGLDIYKVAGLKLKLRPADGHRRRYG